MHAGNAAFYTSDYTSEHDDEESFRIAVVLDSGLRNALSYGTVEDVVVGAFVCNADVHVCLAATARLLSVTLAVVAASRGE